MAEPGCRFYDAVMGGDAAGVCVVVALLGPVEIGSAGGRWRRCLSCGCGCCWASANDTTTLTLKRGSRNNQACRRVTGLHNHVAARIVG
jgi:hypothetical protein